MPHATSQADPLYLDSLTVREEDLMAFSVLGQLAWLAAIMVKEMPTAGCTFATPGSEGGEEFSLPPCRATI
jgi:hypothetical protein